MGQDQPFADTSPSTRPRHLSTARLGFARWTSSKSAMRSSSFIRNGWPCAQEDWIPDVGQRIVGATHFLEILHSNVKMEGVIIASVGEVGQTSAASCPIR